MHYFRLFFKLMGISIKAQMQYRASFFMLIFAHFLSTFVHILGIWVLFDRFKVVAGWHFSEVALIYGIVHMGFAFAESFARGFDTFDQLLKRGDFDRMLLRPLSTLFQIACSQILLMRFGRFFQGLVVLCIAIEAQSIPLFSFQMLVIFWAMAGTACLFYGLHVLQATISFWTIESLELMHIATYGGVEACQYPISIYPKTFQLIFTIIIPLGCVTYYPVATILGREQFPSLFALIFPLAGLLFLALCTFLWHQGVKRYTSTGS